MTLTLELGRAYARAGCRNLVSCNLVEPKVRVSMYSGPRVRQVAGGDQQTLHGTSSSHNLYTPELPSPDLGGHAALQLYRASRGAASWTLTSSVLCQCDN